MEVDHSHLNCRRSWAHSVSPISPTACHRFEDAGRDVDGRRMMWRSDPGGGEGSTHPPTTLWRSWSPRLVT
jgi:hypothetical protein